MRLRVMMLSLFVMSWGLGAVAHAQTVFTPPLVGQLVAYTNAPNHAVTVYQLDGGISQQLSLGEGIHHVWDFSPDGCWLAVTLTPPERPSVLYRVALNGETVQPLLDLSQLPVAEWDAWEADWSPNGDKIAFILSRPTDDGIESRVAWVSAEGGQPQFYSVAGDEHQPLWSVDGAWLAYIAYENRPAGTTPYATAEPAQSDTAPTLREADLWKVSADGLLKERLTWFDVGSVTHPRWSADGNLIAFTYSPTNGADQVWMIASVPNAIPTQLNYEWIQLLDLQWRADGKALLGAVRGLQGQPRATLWELPLVGNSDTQATPYLAEAVPTPADFPRLSQDGQWLGMRTDYRPFLLNLTTYASQTLEGGGNTPLIFSPPQVNPSTDCQK